MFERYTEDSRRVLFFARAKAAERDGDSITPDDLLGGILWGSPHVVGRVIPTASDTLPPTETPENFMRRVHNDERALRGISKQIPFSKETQLVLGRGAEEADALKHQDIRPEHLLLGLLRDEKSTAWRTLHEAGITLTELRRILSEDPNAQS